MVFRASVIVPTYQTVELTRACLAALERAGLDGVEIVLVDNASTDGTDALLDEMEKSARIVRNAANLGFAKACNQGAAIARAPVLIFLNTDTEVHEGWLDPLLAAVEDPAVGLAGSRLLYPNGRVQHAGMALMPGCIPWHIHRGVPGDHPVATQTRDLAIVTAACVAIRRDLFLDENGFDEGYRNGFEDTDLCLRLASRGLVARYCGDSVITHHESMSPGRLDDDGHNMVRFRARWLRWTPDWDRLLAEDGLGLVGPAGTTWSGPLLDDSEDAEFGRQAVADLDAAGLRPLAREIVAGPCPLGMGSRFPNALVAALNRWAVAGPDARTYRHVTACGPLSPEELGGNLVAVMGPGACPPNATLSRAAGLLAVGQAAAETAAMLAPATRLATIDRARPDLTTAADRVAGARRALLPGVGWWGPVGKDTPGRALLGALTASRPVRIVSLDDQALDVGDPLADRVSDEFAPALWVVDAPPVGGDGARIWEQASMALGRGVVGRASFMGRVVAPDVAAACRIARDIWVPTEVDRASLLAAGLDPGGVAVVPVPVDVALFRPPPERQDGPVIFFAPVTWTGDGAWDLLLQAWVEAFRPDDYVKLVLLASDGGASAGDQAVRHLESLGHDPERIPDIELLLEPLPVGDVARLYQDADVVVRAVRRDESGVEVARALACGRRVIATGVGGQHELLTLEGVTSVRAGDLSDLRLALQAVMEGGLSREDAAESVEQIERLRGGQAVGRVVDARLGRLLG